MNVILTFLSGPPAGPTAGYALGLGPTLIGRADNCTLTLSCTSVSRWHCIIDVSSKSVYLTDLHSLNGTYVNDCRVIRQSLNHGDQLCIGRVCFHVTIDASPQQSGSDSPLALAQAPAQTASQLPPTDFSGLVPLPLGLHRRAKRNAVRIPPDGSSGLDVPQLAGQIADYEKALNECTAQLRLLTEKITALEARLNAITLPQHQLPADGKAFERHDALMYIARAAVSEKVRQNNLRPTSPTN